MLVYLHFWFIVLVIVGSMATWKFWHSKNKPDVAITGIIYRKENKKIKEGWLQVVNSGGVNRGYDIIHDVSVKPSKNIFVIGGAREGKTSLGEFLCIKLPERKIVISFKKFQPTKRDFDIGYSWLDVGQHIVPNLFADSQSFVEAFRTAFFADLSMRGLMIDVILDNVRQVMNERPNSFEEFYKTLEKLAGKGQWQANIKTIIKSKVQLLERATAGAKHGDIDFSKGNIVLDLGNLPDEESKTFLAEYYLRQIARIEENEQKEEKIYIVCDEAWHLLRSAQQMSKIGELLLQGAYYIHFLCITQNYTHLDEDYRSHFGTIFCFRNTNDEDISAIKNGYGDLVREGVQKLDETKYQFMDLKFLHGEGAIPAFTLNYENLQRYKDEARKEAEKPQDKLVPIVIGNNGAQAPQVNNAVPILPEPVDISQVVLDVLEKSGVALTKSDIAHKAELKDDHKILHALRKLLNAGSIATDDVLLRKKQVHYYYIPKLEQVHNLMLARTRERINAGWNIVFENKHGIHGADFTIEKNGMRLIVEVETGHKKSLGEFEKKVTEYDNRVLIIVPNAEQKERYSYLPCVNSGKAKIVLIPEIEEVLRNWQ